MEELGSIKFLDKYVSKIEEEEKKQDYIKAFKLLAATIQIINVEIIKNKLGIQMTNNQTDITSIIQIYKKNKRENLYHIMLTINALYEEFSESQEYAEEYYESLKMVSKKLAKEIK